MKKTIAATLVLGLGASTAFAQTLSMQGSDTLFEITQSMLALCQINPANLVYIGSGSTNGENQLVNRNHQISPMSRFLRPTAAVCGAAAPLNNGQGYAFALDAIGMLADDTEATTCNALRYDGTMTVAPSANGNATLECPNCVDGPDGNGVLETFQFNEWQTVLRIIYAGRHNTVAANACNFGDAPSTPSGETAVCNSDVRFQLVNTWSNLFEAGCSDAECTALKHAFRRDDVSGTTDTFLALLSLPSITSTPNPFCNGSEFEDKDPVRRACDGNGQASNGENVCARTKFDKETGNATTLNPVWGAITSANAPAPAGQGDLGLVLPILIPVAAADQYVNNNACASLGFGGQFKYAPMPLSLLAPAAQLCPNGTARALGGCLWPVDAAGNFGCVNSANNRPVGVTGFASAMDGRVYNLTPRRLDGTIPTVPRKQGTATVQRPLLNAGFYRIHQRTLQTNASGTTCQQPDATEQIGCLVHASPCSLGFAGLTADLQDPNKVLAMGAPLAGGGTVVPTDATIRRLLETCTNGGAYATRYPLSRKLFLNTLIGFSNVLDTPTAGASSGLVTQEGQLARCWADRRFTDRASEAAGFVLLDTAGCNTMALPANPGDPSNVVPAACNLADDSPATEIKDCDDAP